MRHTPVADEVMSCINIAFNFIDDFKNIRSEVSYGEQDVFFRLFNIAHDEILKIKWNEMKKEFWSLFNDIDDYNLLIKLYEAKFSRLLKWETVVRINTETMSALTMSDITPFILLHTKNNINLSEKEMINFSTKYLMMLYYMSGVKQEIQCLLDQCRVLVKDSNPNNGKNGELPVDSGLIPQKCSYRLSTKRKTDFIKLLSAMYDAKMFVTKDGSHATNKQNLMEAFGEFLGDDFSTYSVSLSQSKNRDRKTFMRPFTEIEKAAERYLEEE